MTQKMKNTARQTNENSASDGIRTTFFTADHRYSPVVLTLLTPLTLLTLPAVLTDCTREHE
jgi:hypothetical protein